MQRQRDTATEHVNFVERTIGKLLERDTATKHVERTMEKEDAQIDRADNSMENLLHKLFEFLCELLREACTVSAPTSSSPRALLEKTTMEVDCEEIVYDKIQQLAKCDSRGKSLYGEAELLLHKKIFDVMRRDKTGLSKENKFSQWCRRVQRHSRVDASTATEHALAFKALALDILSTELTPVSYTHLTLPTNREV